MPKIPPIPKQGPMAIILAVIWIVLTSSLPARAEPLYLKLLKTTQPNDEQLALSQELMHHHQDVQYREKMRVPPFHKHVTDPVPAEGKAFCQNCHGPLPHHRKIRSRMFMNNHARFIACETCHLRPENIELKYFWLDDVTRQPETDLANRFRTGQKLDNAVARANDARITPFYLNEPASLAKDDPAGKDYLEQWKLADEDGKAQIRSRLHAPLKTDGTPCDQCHREKSSAQKSLLDFAALGASPEQEKAIREHLVPRFFGHYKPGKKDSLEDETVPDGDRIRIQSLLH